jgi:hypothetical protein
MATIPWRSTYLCWNLTKYVRTLTTQDASKAEIYYYTGDQFGNFEAAAYIQAKGSIHFLHVVCKAALLPDVGPRRLS